jgi:hypothetical protein
LQVFDVFDILLPQLLVNPDIEILQRQSALGFSDDKYVVVREVKLGRVLIAKEASSNPELWTGSMGRDGWTVVSIAAEANEAALNDQNWRKFLDAVTAFLSMHTIWRAICASDCDQYPLKRLTLSPESLVGLIDSYRTNNYRKISFVAEAL